VLKQFLNHINRHKLCKPTDKILLAVSGGLDSVVMLHLFKQAGFNVGIAHCNFQLRAEASVEDEVFVGALCSTQHISFHSKRFDTALYAAEKKISIQMAARDLRYDFFKTIMQHHDYDWLATAHHLNDNLETVLLNLVKGTGLDGLVGIPLKKEKKIRPLLFATKSMIINYAKEHQLRWREDASNASDDYQRNFLRHQVIPRLKEINPSIEVTFHNTHERITGGAGFARFFLDRFMDQFVQHKGDQLFLNKEKILENRTPSVLLWELIKQFGFNYDQCIDIAEDHPSGRMFRSPTHDLFIDRTHFIVAPANITDNVSVTIESFSEFVEGGGGRLHSELFAKNTFTLDKSARVAQLDYDKIRFPLVWRMWRPGDAFIPLGMKESKKVSDFLIDLKLSIPEKNKVTVIESAGIIVWVVGMRIHDHFKVGGETNRILKMRFI
jgi:tRNA(Ile)-lysidine synthase